MTDNGAIADSIMEAIGALAIAARETAEQRSVETATYASGVKDLAQALDALGLKPRF